MAEEIKTTIRLPKALWNQIRILAVKNGTTAEALVELGLKLVVKRGGK